MKNNEHTTVQTMSIFVIVQSAFIILKAAGILKWPWWAVFIPFYLEIVLALVVFIILLLYAWKR